MKFQRLLLILMALLLGFFLGRGTAPSDHAGSSMVDSFRHASGASAGSKPVADESEHKASSRPRVREERKASPDQGKRISVPLALVAKDLKERQFTYQTFENMDRAMDTALIMLGATDSEREKVKGVMQKSREAILEAEKTHVKVVKSDNTGVDLDTSAMKDVMPGIVAETQEGLRQSLSPDIGETLNGSIDWSHFYSTYEGEPINTSFAIIRNPNGSLSARTRFGGGSMSRGILPEEFPQDGGAAPVSNFFDNRWKYFLDGIQMAPVDANE